jgi:hypothetical protein
MKKTPEFWLFVALSAIIILVFFSRLLTLTYLPGPVYGGDVYRDRGMVLNILNGNPPYTSSYFLNHSAYYPWLGFIAVAIISWATTLSVDLSYAAIFPLISMIITSVSFFLIGKHFTKNEYAAFFVSLIALAALNFKDLKSILYPVMGLFIMYLDLLIKTSKLKYAALAGLFMGLAGMFRFSEYFVLFITTFLLLLCLLFFEKGKLLNNIIKYIKKYAALFIVSVLVVSPVLIPIYAYHRFDTKNPVFEYGETSLSRLGPGFVIERARRFFLDFSSSFYALRSLLLLSGIALMLTKKKSKSTLLLLFFIFAPMLLSQHFHITKPLLGRWFLPGKFMIMGFIFPIVMGYAVSFIIEKGKGKTAKHISLAFIGAFVVLAAVNSVHSFDNNQWVQSAQGENPGMEELYRLGDFLIENIPEDVSILSGDEAGFMITGISGKKVVTSRRTHVSYYADIEQRIADAAVIMFGNNSNLRKELLAEYKAEYFFEDGMLYNYPMRTVTRHRDYLKENGVVFTEIYERLDIAHEHANFYDLLLIKPELSEGFRSMLFPIYIVGPEEQPMGVLYRIER